MEMNTLSLLMPAVQNKAMSPQAGSGQPSGGFAGLLAMLQQLPGMGPEAAIIALQLAGPEKQAASLPQLFAAILPQLMLGGSESSPEQEDGGAGSAALWLSAVSLGFPLQLSEFAGGGANVKGNSSEATVIQLDTMLQATAVAELGAEKLLPEPMSTVMLQAATTTEVGAEKLSPELLLTGENVAPADEPAATVKLATEKEPLLPWQTLAKAVVDLPVSRLNKAEPLPIQGPAALGYQATPASVTLPAAEVLAQWSAGRAAVAEQVLEKMVFRRELEGDSTLSVRLRPEALGEVQINLRLEEGRLTARIVTENLYVKEALDAALGQVKQRLEAQQIHVAELTVTVGHQQDFQQERTFNPFWQQTEGNGKRSATAAGIAESGGSQPVDLLQGLLDARV